MDDFFIMTQKPYILNDFDYELPSHLIAQEPTEERSASRLLVRGTDGSITHSHISQLSSILPAKSLIIYNASKVIPSRIFARLQSSGHEAEFLFLTPPQGAPYAKIRALGKPIKKMKLGGTVEFAQAPFTATITEIPPDVLNNGIALTFSAPAEEIQKFITEQGFAPLPPYIKRTRQSHPKSNDLLRYQTVYAREPGSIAAPTAGLHFTADLMDELKQRGTDFAEVILHVGMGTFKPVTTANITEHNMHSEQFMLPHQTLEKIIAAMEQNIPVIGVGTTTLRTLESLYRLAEHKIENLSNLADKWHGTDLFIYPRQNQRYEPWCLSALMTNFHQPKSTLFMLIAALLGVCEAHAMYQCAIRENYRFFSYGDSSILWLK